LPAPRRASRRSLALLRGPLAAAVLLAARSAGAVDPFEIQVYDATVNPPGTPGIELHVNGVISGPTTAVPPELPPNHQTHLTAEPSFGILPWWEIGGYLQTAIRPDGDFDFAGVKLRTKFVRPPAPERPFGWGINLELSRLPEIYDRARWGAEVRPIATARAATGHLFFSINPILDWDLAGPEASGRPSFEPAATALYVRDGLGSVGLEYYGNFGPLGAWLPASAQEQYLFEVVNVSRWSRLEVNVGLGEGFTAASNHLVGKMILGLH
jgi:hypothetical protein